MAPSFLWLDTAHVLRLYMLSPRAASNQLDLFTAKQNLVQQVLAVTASVALIVFCLLAIYMFQAIDPKRLVFRHQLIAFLIFFDLMKATILLVFPARVIAYSSAYNDSLFCQAVGFFTATAIEGADLAILAFAIHTFLLIFRPNLTVKIKDSGHIEGGLYRYRYYIYGLSFVIPLAMASFPFIGVGYDSFVCWCYLPQEPYWYRAVLSWVPRYFVVIVILTVYLLIYFHVVREFRLLNGAFSTMHRLRLATSQSPGSDEKPSFFSAFVFFLRDVRMFFFPRFITTDSRGQKHGVNSLSTDSNSNLEGSNDERKNDSPGGPLDLENNLTESVFHAANLENFQKRQKIIEKQMKSIFIYPLAYISIWLFPFILYCTQFDYEQTHGPVVWLNFLSAFIQPFMGVVNSLVFFYREQPWKYTIMRNFKKENESKLDLVLAPGASMGDSESITTSARFTRSSLALTMHVDMAQYSTWRHIMSKCRFPLMQLPSEENIARFQAEHFKRRVQMLREAGNGRRQDINDDHLLGEFTGLRAKHDFSNLLDGGDIEFARNLNRYSLSLQGDGMKQSLSSGNLSGKECRRSIASLSNKSARSRRVSVFDGQAPIPEDSALVGGQAKVMKQQRKSTQTAESFGDDEELDLLDFLGRGPK